MSSAILVPSRCFTAFHVKRSGLCKCGNEARPGQGNCLRCNAEASRKFRKRQAERKAAHRQEVFRAMAEMLNASLIESNMPKRTGAGT
jgi:hypothetical protein